MPILNDAFMTIESVRALMALGNLSSLGRKLTPKPSVEHHVDGKRQDDVCLAYGRDRGETEQEAVVHASVDEFKGFQSDAEFVYLFDGATWAVF
jgi:hypothetical protein